MVKAVAVRLLSGVVPPMTALKAMAPEVPPFKVRLDAPVEELSIVVVVPWKEMFAPPADPLVVSKVRVLVRAMGPVKSMVLPPVVIFPWMSMAVDPV